VARRDKDGPIKPRPGPNGRVLLIAGNWKMNLNHLEAIALVQKVAFSLPDKYLARVEVVVLPPFTDLRSVQTLVDGDKLGIAYGAQDLAAADAGAFTGDISGPMLAKLGCSYVVVGHSERREIHQESDTVVASKVAAAYRNGLRPILCVGEKLDVREAGGQIEHSTSQLLAALEGVTPEQAVDLVVAYEPVWAIGTGRVATPTDAQEACGALRAALAQRFTPEIAAGIRILYGGSVKSSNVAEIVAEADVDGALVGGASLDGTDFALLAANSVGILS
jgi:triosephosphate isomerase (TIM)